MLRNSVSVETLVRVIVILGCVCANQIERRNKNGTLILLSLLNLELVIGSWKIGNELTFLIPMN